MTAWSQPDANPLEDLQRAAELTHEIRRFPLLLPSWFPPENLAEAEEWARAHGFDGVQVVQQHPEFGPDGA